ncbi:hypothetical protein JCM11491_004174 [Sporobolomyces phaffii]
MYGVGPNWEPLAGSPGDPIGPDIANRDDWWFRGPGYRSLKPQNDSVMSLPAGGRVEIEITCNVAFTSYGVSPSNLSDPLAACPGNSGAFHSGTPGEAIDEDLLSGCALAIADKDDIEQVGWDDLAVFSVNQRCVRDRVTSFEIPKQLPKCSGDKCICAWLWLANNGTGNFYMTGFDCSVEPGSDPLPILPPVDPEFCPSTNDTCIPAKGAKRPLYAYNSPSNIEWHGNDHRPGYHESWSFFDGAQDDIFDRSGQNATYSISSTDHSATRTPQSSSRRSSLVPPSSSPAPTSARTSFSTPSSASRLLRPATSSTSTSESDSPVSSARHLAPPIPPTLSAYQSIASDRATWSPTARQSGTSSTPVPSSSSSLAHALKLALPSLAPTKLKRQHDLWPRFSHDRHDPRGKRNSIVDELIEQAAGSQNSGGAGRPPLSVDILLFGMFAFVLSIW